MSRKAAINAILFILLLITLAWIPRIAFYFVINSTESIADLAQLKYLKWSALFDLKTIAIWYSPFFLWLLFKNLMGYAGSRRVDFIFILIFTLSFLSYGFTAILYYPISKSIAGKELFTSIGGQSMDQILAYVGYFWWLILALILFGLFVANILVKLSHTRSVKRNWPMAIVLLLFWGLAVRGSFSLKPLNHLDAYDQLDDMQAVSSMTPAYILIESLGQSGLEPFDYLSNESLKSIQKNDYTAVTPLGMDQPNICIILLESFSLEYTGLNTAGAPSYTPFLDSLAQLSVCFDQAFANGLRSMDAVASVFLGVPELMTMPYVGSLYAHNQTHSLYELLSTVGYESYFFHGADVESMGFRPFLRSHGLDHYYGLQDYPDEKDYDGKWGIFDEPFFLWFGKKMSQAKEPWFSTLFSLSSHHPYKVPEDYSNISEGTQPIHRSIMYTDQALGAFFDAYQNEDWFKNTVFIITADHGSTNENRRYYTNSGKYAIPMMVYGHDSLLHPRKENKPVQQIDIFPTVCTIAGVERDSLFSFGRSLFDTLSSQVVHYDGISYSLVAYGHTLVWKEGKVMGLFNNMEDPDHKKNLKSEKKELVREMSHILQCRIQNYNHRLITNSFR